MSNTFISNPMDARKGTVSNLMDDTKMEEAADTLEDRAGIQRDPKSGEMRQIESHEAE